MHSDCLNFNGFTTDIVCDIMYLALSLAANQMPTKMYSKTTLVQNIQKPSPLLWSRYPFKKVRPSTMGIC